MAAKKPEAAPADQPPVIQAGPWSWRPPSAGGTGGTLLCNGAAVALGPVNSSDLSTLALRLQELANKISLAGY